MSDIRIHPARASVWICDNADAPGVPFDGDGEPVVWFHHGVYVAKACPRLRLKRRVWAFGTLRTRWRDWDTDMLLAHLYERFRPATEDEARAAWRGRLPVVGLGVTRAYEYHGEPRFHRPEDWERWQRRRVADLPPRYVGPVQVGPKIGRPR